MVVMEVQVQLHILLELQQHTLGVEEVLNQEIQVLVEDLVLVERVELEDKGLAQEIFLKVMVTLIQVEVEVEITLDHHH
tara:strand:+ start:403 stop:639 length:237 start_codon:yes stop_codon:yes gene_type:complete